MAYCMVEGQEEKVHVPNTGRCKELLVPGAKIILSKASPEKLKTRKTAYDLISVYKGESLINMDSQSPNAIAEEALAQGKIGEISGIKYIKREKTFDKSRFDLYYERVVREETVKGFIEVKGVTLEKDGNVYFPDAPTERGLKHLQELVKAHRCGYEAAVLFVVQMEDVKRFYPNLETHRAFGEQLLECQKQGVKVLCYSCRVKEDQVVLDSSVPVCNLEEYLEENRQKED